MNADGKPFRSSSSSGVRTKLPIALRSRRSSGHSSASLRDGDDRNTNYTCVSCKEFFPGHHQISRHECLSSKDHSFGARRSPISKPHAPQSSDLRRDNFSYADAVKHGRPAARASSAPSRRISSPTRPPTTSCSPGRRTEREHAFAWSDISSTNSDHEPPTLWSGQSDDRSVNQPSTIWSGQHDGRRNFRPSNLPENFYDSEDDGGDDDNDDDDVSMPRVKIAGVEQRSHFWKGDGIDTNLRVFPYGDDINLPKVAVVGVQSAAGMSAGDISEDIVLDTKLRELLVNYLVNHLRRKTQRSSTIMYGQRWIDARDQISETFAELLNQFAVLLQCEAQLHTQLRSAIFVRAQQEHIVGQFMDAIEVKELPEDGRMRLEEMAALWEIQARPIQFKLKSEIDTPLEQLDLQDSELGEAVRFVTEGATCQWLVRQMSSLLHDTIENTGTSLMNIRKHLINGMSAARLQHKSTSQVCIMLPWNPVTFLDEQFPGRSHISLADVICLVGHPTRAFASTCKEYADFVWPSIGSEMLRCLDSVCGQLRSRHVDIVIVQSNKEFALTVEVPAPHQQSITVTVYSSSPVTLLEACEVLCWAATVCRSSSTSSICRCSSRLHTQGNAYHLDISPLTGQIEGVETNANGMCWTKMFNNPMLVDGYPIPSREDNEAGLEISIDLMSVLADAHRATVFDGWLILKGFCTMLVHVARQASSSTWHFLGNNDLSWICYSKAQPFASPGGCFEYLNQSRHFVGWTHDGICTAGEFQLCNPYEAAGLTTKL